MRSLKADYTPAGADPEQGQGRRRASPATSATRSRSRSRPTATASSSCTTSTIRAGRPGSTASARPILRANLLFRGVEVGPGSHRVEFRFRPLSIDNLVAAAPIS